ncbi:hypothetical protein [Paenibacillus sp. GYB003]|uniref:hypothetical protein n=1 Tax=Paenibacillus sp. GYB003 TaxID=2994392 RepID=UPI002F961368
MSLANVWTNERNRNLRLYAEWLHLEGDIREDEMMREGWGAALDLGEQGRNEIKGRPLSDYLTILSEVRQKTLDGFKQRGDDWLFEQTPFWEGYPANNYFKWVHVFEDEINHRGQIRWIRKRLPM